MFVQDENGKMNSGVTVKRSELLDKVKNNRTKHREDFLEAKKGFLETLIKELSTRLADAQSGKTVDSHFALVEPEDHTKDYDRVICMLEMCVKDEILISESEFSQYVMDEWTWKHMWTSINASYSKKV